jgi:hypothetical protein
VKRKDLEHLVRAAADITKDEIVVIGSQAILGEYPDAPETLLVSLEADVYPRYDPDRADEIDGAIGDGSPFHETFGYYAHGVGPETPIAPAGWETRLVRIEAPIAPTGAAIGWCLGSHDLVLSKLAAGRERDLDFALEAIRAELVDIEQLRLGVELLPESHRKQTRERLEGVIKRI